MRRSRVQFLPPNTTSKYQPIDAGIISAFKRRYRRLHLQNALNREDQGLTDLFKVEQLTAMQWSLAAWRDLSAESIKNYFKPTGLFKQTQAFIVDEEEAAMDDELQQVIERLHVQNSMSIANLLNPIEEEIAHIEQLIDEEIVEVVQQNDQNDQNREPEKEEGIQQYTKSEKLKALSIMTSMLDLSRDLDFQVYKHVTKLQNEIRFASTFQTTLDSWLFQ